MEPESLDMPLAMPEHQKLKLLLNAIVEDDVSAVKEILSVMPALAKCKLEGGATRQNSTDFFVEKLMHYLYTGDTALHVSAIAYSVEISQLLIRYGAEVRAKNRRGAEPLHYACDGSPNHSAWNSDAQRDTVFKLIEWGACPNCLDKSGVAPIHRAVRSRCTGAVRGLIDGGADVNLKNKSGSTPLRLANLTTGRSGSGSEECKRECAAIIELLTRAGAHLG